MLEANPAATRLLGQSVVGKPFPVGLDTRSAEAVYAVVALGLCQAAYFSEDLRSGLRAVPPGQAEAARALRFRSRDLKEFGVIDAVIEEPDKEFSIYEVPLGLVDNGLDQLIVDKLGLQARPIDMSEWQHLLHKVTLAVIAWGIFGVLLVGRVRWGWRGRKALQFTTAGFVILALAYFGSKFVLETLLGKHWG